jgi:pSer/pThr/pTyr-binding forkhead associated (FHA) protein
MQVVLVMFRSDGERRSFSVVRNMTVIGRREDCDLRIPVGDVSRKHCRLVRTDDGIRIEDLGSSNGTYVNSQRVQESELNPGDLVGVGPVQFIVQINGVPDENEMTPPGTAAQAQSQDTAITEVPPEHLEEAALEEIPQETQAQEMPVDEAPAEAIATDEILTGEIPEEITEEVSLDELQEPEPASPLDAPLDELEEVNLDEPGEIPAAPPPPLPPPLPPVPMAIEPQPAPAPEAAGETIAHTEDDGDWNFVIEETESDRSHTDFEIDLDTPHK